VEANDRTVHLFCRESRERLVAAPDRRVIQGGVVVMPVEMFEKLGVNPSVDSWCCSYEADCFRWHKEFDNASLSECAYWYWQTIRDLMLSGF
jgi:hypothetical protein